MSDAEPWAGNEPDTPAVAEEDQVTGPEANRYLGGHAPVLLALVLLLTRMHL